MAGPLEHLKVVEVSRTLAGALCAKLLADLGARTVKIEPPEGDPLRRLGPFPDDQPHPERSGWFLYANTNKHSLQLDLDRPEGKTLLAELAAWADILVEDWSVARPLPLTDPPHLIHVSITPFGRSGPYATWEATELTSFHASAAGHRYNGMPDREPIRTPGLQAHQWAGLAAANGALMAYFARRWRGRGQRVEIAETEVLAELLVAYSLVTIYFETGQTEPRVGWRNNQGAPCGTVRCKDGYVAVWALEPHQWEGLVEAMGNPEWAQTELFRGSSWDRDPYKFEIYALMEEWLSSHTRQEIFEACQARRVPSVPVLNIAEVAAADHHRVRGYFVEYDSPAAGRLRVPGAPFRLSRTPWAIRLPPPRRGEHTDVVLRGWLGHSPAELATWRQQGIIGGGDD